MRQSVTVTGPFVAPVVYVQPTFKELKRRFPAEVSPLCKRRKFDPIDLCKGVSKESREVAFKYIQTRGGSTQEMLAILDRRGLRPALYEELLGFAKKYPDEQREHAIVALGSVMSFYSPGIVTCLWHDLSHQTDNLVLDTCWVDKGWHSEYCFLGVPK